jgi:hypothetical protein
MAISGGRVPGKVKRPGKKIKNKKKENMDRGNFSERGWREEVE